MKQDQKQFGRLKQFFKGQSKGTEEVIKSNRKMPTKPWRQFISSLYSNRKDGFATRHLKTQPHEVQIKKERSNPRKILAMKREDIRLKTRERKKKNQETFYKKHDDFKTLSPQAKENGSINYSFSSSKIKNVSLHDDQSKKKLREVSPFMLRKRSLKMEKQMRIIEHFYERSLNKINSQEFLKTSLNFQNQKSLINRMKGSKMYYQFVREWKFPKDEEL